MEKLENHITLENLENARNYLVPYVFSENYFNILRKRMQGKMFSENERYYYNHFIKKKLMGMIELFGISTMINGKHFIRGDRLKKAIAILSKYSRKHKNMKMLITGSFLFSEKYNDVDVFVISKYNKEDYRDGKVHINYLPPDVEKSLFFKSIYAISIANFTSESKIEEEFNINDILHIYETVVLLLMQKNEYLQELRDLI
ncbi:hypothetical protein JXA85_04130, partial [Candidatus Woesearchaeota archaeon]|nr:hypothetical protein [Candidatus Woesearchaeota archaeon]